MLQTRSQERVKVLEVQVMVQVLVKGQVKGQVKELAKVELKLIPLHNQSLVQGLMKVVL